MSVVPPGQSAHGMSFDEVGNFTQYDPPGAGSDETNYEYTGDHELEYVNQPDGSTIAIHRNSSTARVESVITSDGAELTPTYDGAGRIEHIVGPHKLNVEIDFTYKGPLLTSATWSGVTPGSVEFGYNSLGLPGSQTINGTSSVSYTYDNDDLLLSAGAMTLGRSASTGQVQTLTLGDLVDTLSYDSFGDVDGSATLYDGTDEVYEYALVRDQFGRIIQDEQTVEGGTPVTWEYGYDDRGRLETVDQDGLPYASYTYDANGNRLSVTTAGTTSATYDGQDRILTHGAWTYTHGANGEIKQKTDGQGTTWKYAYDALGNLLSVTLPDLTVIRYEYDAAGRVVARYEDDVYDKGWLWESQLEPVAEVDELGDVTARYVYGSRGHVPDYVVTDQGTYRIVTDYRGSVRMVVDSSGVAAQTIEYGPWGEVLADDAPGFQSFGYAGGLYDADTGLVLFGARWYDAETGRWVRKDPARFGGGVNLYQYAYGSPLASVDPSGNAPMDGNPNGTGQFPALQVFWRNTFGVPDRAMAQYYAEQHGYENVIVRRGGFVDWARNDLGEEGTGAVTTFGIVWIGSSCDAEGPVSASYPSHEYATTRDHELGHIIFFRRYGAWAYLGGALDLILFQEKGGNNWFEHEATKYARELWR